MKITLLAATLALTVGAPLMASASQSVPASSTAMMMAGHETQPQGGDAMPAAGQSVRPRFIGPFQLHHGLLPNGLAPNPFTYG